MVIAKNINQTRKIIDSVRRRGKIIGLVPTMGALHEGHLALMRAARRDCDYVMVSIFVNPIQFGRNEDYSRYPKTFGHDMRLLRDEKIDLLFCPAPLQMYANDFSTYVGEVQLSRSMCGVTRPGHFKGVCTVVTKLFNIVAPDIAYFGQKDFQQATIIKKMTRDLNFRLQIKVVPTVRERDGLALSSRNAYLNTQERLDARILFQALLAAKNLIKNGERNSKKVIRSIVREISVRTRSIDYVTIVDATNLSEVKVIKGKVVIAVAAYIGTTRLIDNILVNAMYD
jgi:pantoate--beta-alanine ligase